MPVSRAKKAGNLVGSEGQIGKCVRCRTAGAVIQFPFFDVDGSGAHVNDFDILITGVGFAVFIPVIQRMRKDFVQDDRARVGGVGVSGRARLDRGARESRCGGAGGGKCCGRGRGYGSAAGDQGTGAVLWIGWADQLKVISVVVGVLAGGGAAGLALVTLVGIGRERRQGG